MIYIKNEKEIELMEESARVLKLVLKAIEKEIKPGVTTGHLDKVAERVMRENGATPSFKGVECPYEGGKPYRWAICTSVNDEIIHGIPSDKVVLKEGDIVSVRGKGKYRFDGTTNLTKKNRYHVEVSRYC